MLLRKVTTLQLFSHTPFSQFSVFFQFLFLCALAAPGFGQSDEGKEDEVGGSPRGHLTTPATPTLDQSTKFMLSDTEKAALAEIVVDMESELLRVNSTHLASSIDGTSPGVGPLYGQTSESGSGPSGPSGPPPPSGSGAGPSGPLDFSVNDSELGSGLFGSGAYVDYEEYEYDEMYNPFELPQTDPLAPLSLTQLADQYIVPEGEQVRGDEPRFARQSDLGEIIATIDEKQRKARQFSSTADQQFNQVQFTAEQLEQQRQFAEQQQRFNLRQQQFGQQTQQQQQQQQQQQFSLRAQQLFNGQSQSAGGQFSALGSQPSGPITQRFQTPGFKNFPSKQTQTLLQQPQQNLLQQPQQSLLQQPRQQQPQQTLLQSQNSLFGQQQQQFGQQPQSQFSSEQTFGSQQTAAQPQQQQFFQGQQFQGGQQQFGRGRQQQNFGQPQPAQAQPQPQTPLPQQVKFVSFGREQDDQNPILTSPSPIATSPASPPFQSFPARPTPPPAVGPSAAPQFESQRQNQGAQIRVRPVGSPSPTSQGSFPGFQGFDFESPRSTVPLQQAEQADFVTTRPPRPPNAKPPPNADPRQPGRFTSPRAPPSGSRFSVGNLMTRL